MSRIRNRGVRELPDTSREKIGGQGRNRTTDTRIFSPLLYLLSYLALDCFVAALLAMTIGDAWAGY